MVVIRTENTPLSFVGQVVQYNAGVLNTQNERIITEVANTPITFTHVKVEYSSPGGNPSNYTTV